ncbi:hypothetical protein [Paenibacillus lignilyticus]|uniref:Heparinase II/III-like protein n=1 Tax=Paenibacillus lignilyticus TaxID=1172615 RepID=A0ABS5C7H5_9BACL|nr:hypothetical protein [Paenibacillus lignilyticus]MBP3961951.1 hypothetical protein [Paenibacillus lignilyticus]
MAEALGWTKDNLLSWLAERDPAEQNRYGEEASSAAKWEEIAGSPHYADMVREVEKEGKLLEQTPIPELTSELYGHFERTGNRLMYEGVYFQRRRRLAAFAIRHFLYPSEKSYIDALEEIIAAILVEPTWCLPAHMRGQAIDRHIDLFAAETGFALAEIIMISGEGHLSMPLQDAIRLEVDRRLFAPYLNLGPYHWETADHNWASVCAGAIASAALLLESDTDRLAAILEKAIGTMGHYLSGFGEDGACLEGPGYWNYGFGYFVAFADLLHRGTCGKANLLADNKVRSIAQFQQRCYLAGNRPANFSDAVPDVNVHIGLSDYLASYYKEVEYPPLAVRASFSDDHCWRFAHALRNFIWHKPHAPRAESWQSGSWFLPDAEWLVSRCTSAAGSFGFAAKGGTNQEPHNHIDVGHFILLADEDPAFAADLGSGEYTADYFGEGRYGYDCNGAQGHSLPIIGGHLQAVGAQSAAVVLDSYIGAEEDRFELELASCYPSSGLTSYRRLFSWHKGSERPMLELRDAIRFAGKPSSITETFITRAKPVLLADGQMLLQGERHAVRLDYDPGCYEVRIEERMYSNHYGQEESYSRIYLDRREEMIEGDAAIQLGFQFKFSE